MGELKPKKPVRRRVMKAANSPEPTGPVGGSMPTEPTDAMCGHSDCSGGKCSVRYVGPTSHMRDHHIVHAARGISHIWSAAIITGLAIVLTGAIAFNSVEAQTDKSKTSATTSDVQALAKRLDRMEKMLKDVADKCLLQAKDKPAEVSKDSATTPTPVACTSCAGKLETCLKAAGDNTAKTDACKALDAKCTTSCK
ncbi:MAG: hypothetical protein WC787_03780 [Patescibacteria group bacterium]|jgi:hypothetical protein